VDRLSTDEGKSFSPDVLLGDSGVTVTAKVIAHERGPKILIGKYRRRTGYKRHTGFRAALSTIQIETIGVGKASAKKAPAKAEQPAEKPADAPKGMPSGYADMTVAEINEGVKSWNRPMLEAALEYEQAHAKRKGAISALEHALAAKEED
jgi:large subunit ribosomal protein L21